MNFRVWLEAVAVRDPSQPAIGPSPETPGHNMAVKIKDNPVVTGGSVEADHFRRTLKSLAGQWLKVETDHLFGDQFNTTLMRVFLDNVQEIRNDVRPQAAKCGWCGATFLWVPDSKLYSPCPKCDAYPMQDMAVIDRIRPLLSVQNGKIITIYSGKMKRIKTPEGDVFRHK